MKTFQKVANIYDKRSMTRKFDTVQSSSHLIHSVSKMRLQVYFQEQTRDNFD